METNEFKNKFLPHHIMMYRTAYAFLRNSQEAEDILQEAFLKLWLKREELDAIDNTEAYCITLVRHLCLDLIRNRKKHLHEGIQECHAIEHSANLQKELEQHTEAETVRTLINQLPDTQRKVIWLRDINECSFEEISRATGLNPINIRATLSKARKKIREQFNRWIKEI